MGGRTVTESGISHISFLGVLYFRTPCSHTLCHVTLRSLPLTRWGRLPYLLALDAANGHALASGRLASTTWPRKYKAPAWLVSPCAPMALPPEAHALAAALGLGGGERHVSRDGPAKPPEPSQPSSATHRRDVEQRLIEVALLWVVVTWQWLTDTVLNF